MPWPEPLIASLGINWRRATREGHWIIQCPLPGHKHGDRSPSASIRIGDTGVCLVKCYACKHQMSPLSYFRSFCEATGTQPWQWCKEGNDSRARSSGSRALAKIEATYDYTDQHGKLLFQVCRFGKENRVPFLARRPARDGDDSKDGWVWEGVGRDIPLGIPYQLARIINNPSHAVLITEGEKDADNLISLGYTATTNAFGAGNWTLDHAQWLIGRRCVIFEDNDLAGQRRTQQVAGSLLCVGAESIRVIRFTELAEHADVSDWLDLLKLPQAGIRQKINERVKSAPLWSIAKAA